MRKFEFAQKDGKQMYDKAQIPVYSTQNSAGADFFCAEDITIPSKAKVLLQAISEADTDKREELLKKISAPVLIHTGIKAAMENDEVLKIYNRSSGPKKGLVLANSVGIIDADYYSNPDNDGEIMFAYYNVSEEDIVIKAGDKIGQGVFVKFLRPDDYISTGSERTGGFGSTGR